VCHSVPSTIINNIPERPSCCPHQVLVWVVPQNPITLPTPCTPTLFCQPTGSPSWTPGDEELEQAALAVSLLARLPGALRSHDALLAAGASAAATGSLSGLRDDMWLLWQALAGHDKDAGAVSGILVRHSSACVPSCSVCRCL
jgi:hypothetical protein